MFFKKFEKFKVIVVFFMVVFDEIKKDLVVDLNKFECLFDDVEFKCIFVYEMYILWVIKYFYCWWFFIFGFCMGVCINEIV